MNNEKQIAALKADKGRVLAELNFIKEALTANDFQYLNTVEDLQMYGYDIETNLRATISTPGGHFSFFITDIERIIAQVEIYYPEDFDIDVTADNLALMTTLLENIVEARENLKQARTAKNTGLIELFTEELAKIEAHKNLVLSVYA